MSSSRSPRRSNTRLAVACVVGVKGLRGQLKVERLTDVEERLKPGTQLLIEGDDRPRRIAGTEERGRILVLALEGIETREAAQALVGRYLETEARELPPGTYYWHELIGISVRDEHGALVGEVAEVFRAGENEVYRVDGPGGETLVPGLRDVVIGLDIGAREMVVRLDAEDVR